MTNNMVRQFEDSLVKVQRLHNDYMTAYEGIVREVLTLASSGRDSSSIEVKVGQVWLLWGKFLHIRDVPDNQPNDFDSIIVVDLVANELISRFRCDLNLEGHYLFDA